jgi:hypothetical protein
MENFRVQLTGSLACRWNRRAADVFSTAYIEVNGPQFKEEDLATCFKIHLRSLQDQCKRIIAGPARAQAEIENSSTSARRTRRQGVRMPQIPYSMPY